MGRHVPAFHMATSCRASEMPARNIRVTLRGEGTVMIRRRTLFGVATGLLAAKARAQPMTDAPIATTAHGPVRGATEDGILAFKGIAYGATTAGGAGLHPPAAPRLRRAVE